MTARIINIIDDPYTFQVDTKLSNLKHHQECPGPSKTPRPQFVKPFFNWMEEGRVDPSFWASAGSYATLIPTFNIGLPGALLWGPHL